MNVKTIVLVASVALTAAIRAETVVTNYIQSSWQAVNSVATGNFSESEHWTAGVPSVQPNAGGEVDVITGTIAPSAAIVTNDVAREIPYLVMNNASKLFVEAPLKFAPPPMYKTGTTTRNGAAFDLNGKVTVTVPKDSSLVWEPMARAASSGGSYIRNGAHVIVDGGLLSFTNLWDRDLYYIQGSLTATTKVDVVNGGHFVVAPVVDNNVGGHWAPCLGQYAQVNIQDSTLTLRGWLGQYVNYPSEDAPAGELNVSGKSTVEYISTVNADCLCGSATTTYSGESCFTNRSSSKSLRFTISPYSKNSSQQGGKKVFPCRLNFKDHASACFAPSDTVYIGNKGVTNTYVSVDSDGSFDFGTRLQVGTGRSYSELALSGGQRSTCGSYGLQIGVVPDVNADNYDAKGAVKMSSGVLVVKGLPNSSSDICGLVIGSGLLAKTDKTSNHVVGTLDLSGGIVTNGCDCVIGAGYATGSFSQSGGLFQNDGNTAIIGFAGGSGRWDMTGGKASFSQGRLWIGGVTAETLKRTFGANCRAVSRLGCATGTLSIANAKFSYTSGSGAQWPVTLGEDGKGTLELGEGGDCDIFGSLVAKNGAASEVRFVFGATGGGLLTVRCGNGRTATLSVSEGAKLTVDGRRYRGTASWVQLVKLGTSADWGSSQGVAGGDRFTEVETLGDVTVVQNPADDPKRPGVWAHFKRGLVLLVR